MLISIINCSLILIYLYEALDVCNNAASFDAKFSNSEMCSCLHTRSLPSNHHFSSKSGRSIKFCCAIFKIIQHLGDKEMLSGIVSDIFLANILITAAATIDTIIYPAGFWISLLQVWFTSVCALSLRWRLQVLQPIMFCNNHCRWSHLRRFSIVS